MKAFLLYHDFLSAAKANAALHRSASGIQVDWNIRPWRVDMLKFPPLAEEAIIDALDAQMILFVGRCSQSLPFWLHDWLEHWATRRHFPDVVLAIMPDGNSHTPATSSELLQLTQFAHRHGLSLILGNQLTAHSIPLLPSALSATAAAIHRGWGLNE
jgi:hypothetical protein